MEAVCRQPFQMYFHANWLHDNWHKAWQDLNQVLGCNKGLKNTNNVTEAVFKTLSYMYLNKKKAVAPDSLVLMIVLGLFMHFMVQYKQYCKGMQHMLMKSKQWVQHTEKMVEATLHKHLDLLKPILLQLYSISNYHINTALLSCTCCYHVYMGKRCKHVIMLLKLERMGDDAYPMWILEIDPSIFSYQVHFTGDGDHQHESLGQPGPAGRLTTMEPQPHHCGANQLLSDNIINNINFNEDSDDDNDQEGEVEVVHVLDDLDHNLNHDLNPMQASNHPASSGEEEEEPVSITITMHKKKFMG
jgi:hypothetical protein